jgi:hypothetical protein
VAVGQVTGQRAGRISAGGGAGALFMNGKVSGKMTGVKLYGRRSAYTAGLDTPGPKARTTFGSLHGRTHRSRHTPEPRPVHGASSR